MLKLNLYCCSVSGKMKRFVFFELFFLFTVSTVLSVDYDEVMARYKIWPMASAAFSDNPGLCVKDNYKDGEVWRILLTFKKPTFQFKKQYTVQCDLAKDDSCSGFTAVSHSDKAIILSFR